MGTFALSRFFAHTFFGNIKGSGLSLSYFSYLLHNPAHTRVMQLKVSSQLRHGVAASSKGCLDGCVAIVGVLLCVSLKWQGHRSALDVRNLQAGSPDAHALWGLLGLSTHFVDEFLVTQVHLPV